MYVVSFGSQPDSTLSFLSNEFTLRLSLFSFTSLAKCMFKHKLRSDLPLLFLREAFCHITDRMTTTLWPRAAKWRARGAVRLSIAQTIDYSVK